MGAPDDLCAFDLRDRRPGADRLGLSRDLSPVLAGTENAPATRCRHGNTPSSLPGRECAGWSPLQPRLPCRLDRRPAAFSRSKLYPFPHLLRHPNDARFSRPDPAVPDPQTWSKRRRRDRKRRKSRARLKANEAAVEFIEQKALEENFPEEVMVRVRAEYCDRIQQLNLCDQSRKSRRRNCDPDLPAPATWCPPS